MNLLELEMYHQIKNVQIIGVNLSFYEYLFMVDANTAVDPLSVNRLISAYVCFFWPFICQRDGIQYPRQFHLLIRCQSYYVGIGMQAC